MNPPKKKWRSYKKKVYLYAVEAWWKIDDVSKRLLLLERKLLRCILCVKSNTPDDLLYLEFDRHDLISWIKHRQHNFFQNLLQLRDDEAVARRIVSLYRHLPLFEYYDNLDPDVITKNREDRLNRVRNATTTYIQRYNQLIDTTYNHVIYESYIPEYLRIVITRWRLSNHELKIETGRREKPFVPRALRLCTTCGVVEDEEHVVYNCPLYNPIRLTFREFMIKYPVVTRVFNPENADDARELGRFLIAIEKERKRLGLQQEWILLLCLLLLCLLCYCYACYWIVFLASVERFNIITDIFKFSTSVYSLTFYVYDAEDTTVIFYVGQHQLMM